MKKNQFTKLLQNKTILAALLILLMAGTAVAGITAVRKANPDKGTGDEETESIRPGLVQESTEDDKNAQLAVPDDARSDPGRANNVIENAGDSSGDPSASEAQDKPVQSGKVDAVWEESGASEIPEPSDDSVTDKEETLVDADGAVVYTPDPKEDAADEPVGAGGTALTFAEGSHIAWPVEGNIVLDYSMDSTIYFPTLKQYKCNPGILIQSEVGAPVEASTRGIVTAVDSNEELGSFVTMDLGGGYTIIYGQLSDVAVEQEQLVEAGELVGYVAEPTKYYVVEGPNLYLELQHDGTPVDPLDYIR